MLFRSILILKYSESIWDKLFDTETLIILGHRLHDTENLTILGHRLSGDKSLNSKVMASMVNFLTAAMVQGVLHIGFMGYAY